MGRMDLASLTSRLQHLNLGSLHYYDTIGSTNAEAGRHLAQDAPHASLFIADEQTRGRGRAGRGWYTPPGSALAFSLLLRYEPAAPIPDLATFSGLGALAVSTVLEDLGLVPEIKWPNDVLLDGKKLTGILPEAYWHGDRLDGIVLGIGVNVGPASVPQTRDLMLPATCLEVELGQPIERAQLLAEILVQILAWRNRQFDPAFIQAWESRLAFRDQTIEIQNGTTVARGVIQGLERDGALRIKLESGAVQQFQAGDLRMRPAG